jgi:Putative zinc-finger
MERALLRPVPTRPAGPVDEGAAAAFVAARLPGLDEEAAGALARVEIAGRERSDTDAGALARARKEVRRSLAPLRGSGWCERAERALSDRLDGVLEAPARARLEAHLVNCPRCVEHDLRLAQATDSLLRDFALAHPGLPAPAAVSDQPSGPPSLRAVEDAPAAPEPVGPSRRRGAVAALVALAILLVLAAVALALALGRDL